MFVHMIVFVLYCYGFITICLWIHWNNLPEFFRVASLALAVKELQRTVAIYNWSITHVWPVKTKYTKAQTVWIFLVVILALRLKPSAETSISVWRASQEQHQQWWNYQCRSLTWQWWFSNHIILDLLRKSHNAPVPYPRMHHFVTEMCTRVHISVTKWCIVDLRDRSY